MAPQQIRRAPFLQRSLDPFLRISTWPSTRESHRVPAHAMESTTKVNGRKAPTLNDTETEPAAKRLCLERSDYTFHGEEAAISYWTPTTHETDPVFTSNLMDMELGHFSGSGLPDQLPNYSEIDFDFSNPSTRFPNSADISPLAGTFGQLYNNDTTWQSSTYSSFADISTNPNDIFGESSNSIPTTNMWDATQGMDPMNFNYVDNTLNFGRIPGDSMNSISALMPQISFPLLEEGMHDSFQIPTSVWQPSETQSNRFTDGITPCSSDFLGVIKSPNSTTTATSSSPAQEQKVTVDEQTSETEYSLKYDTCFGVIVATPSSSLKSESHPKRSSVTIKYSGNIMKLYSKETDTYAGILIIPALCKLVRAFQVHLEATLILAKGSLSSTGKSRKKPHQSKSSTEQHSARVVVYGHPLATECDRQAEYDNPHYLVRPGALMPQLEDLSLDEADQGTKDQADNAMEETMKSRVLHVFDLADAHQYSTAVEPSPKLQSPLMEHQLKALAMMVDKESDIVATPEFPSIWVSMPLKGNANRHVRRGQMKTVVYHGPNRQRLSAAFQDAAIVLTTYETLRMESQATKSCLYSNTWHRLVLDEAHHIRNRNSLLFDATCKVQARYRWCLTGTPIHNSLDDYGALLSFLRIPSFVEKQQFDYWIAQPLKKQMPQSLERLQDLVKATCLRRRKSAMGVSFQLPQRVERVESVTLRQDERDLYTFFEAKLGAILQESTMPSFQDSRKPETTKTPGVLTFITFLRRICDHSTDLLPTSAIEAWSRRDTDGNFGGVMDGWASMQSYEDRCEICGEDVETPGVLDPRATSKSRRRLICEPCAISTSKKQGENKGSAPRAKSKIPSLASPKASEMAINPSSKVCALLKNLHAEQSAKGSIAPPIKSVVFTSWTEMLDLIEIGLRSENFSWVRIDGKTSLKSRNEAMRRFNEDPHCTVMVASIGSAGEGVDFTVANHVHIIEPHWNPMIEAQAVDRVHRIGQARPVTVIKYIVLNTVETYIKWVQKDKLRLIAQSIDFVASTTEIESQRWNKLHEFLNL
ncbi:putative Helicase C-terminal domain-containing protein [Seiridium cardinale]|uniref:Helicase C-terminal domain-containing protein n=1 Tax=Seiridium cardinale TaxID=138064 RepID=A0ABR2XKI6_9PEZI